MKLKNAGKTKSSSSNSQQRNFHFSNLIKDQRFLVSYLTYRVLLCSLVIGLLDLGLFIWFSFIIAYYARGRLSALSPYVLTSLQLCGGGRGVNLVEMFGCVYWSLGFFAHCIILLYFELLSHYYVNKRDSFPFQTKKQKERVIFWVSTFWVFKNFLGSYLFCSSIFPTLFKFSLKRKGKKKKIQKRSKTFHW